MTGGTGDTGGFESLLGRTGDLTAGAVDTLEIVAGLEADGLNDEAAARYGYPDVFALAEDLYERTARRPPPTPPPPNPWRAQVWRHLLRGLLFGLPGLCYAIAIPVLTRPDTGYLLIESLLLSWSMSQGVAYLAYRRMGQGNPAAGARALRRGLAAGVLVVAPIIAGSGVLLDAGPRGTGLAVGQCVYLLAATAALVAGAEPWLLAALLPGAVASLIQLAAGGPAHPAVWIAWGCTIAATIAIAVVHTRAGRRPAGSRPRREGRPEPGRRGARSLAALLIRPWGDIVAALPYALFGLFAGGLLTFGTVATLLGLASTSQATTVAVLALSLSMGPAEWVLFSYRRHVHGLLATRTGMGPFARSARGALAVAVAAYAAGLLALAAAVVAVGEKLGGLPHDLAGKAATPWIAGAGLALGCAFFVALLLQSSGHIKAVVGCCAVVLAAEAAVTPAVGRGTVQLTVQFAAAAGLCAILLIYALVVLGRATSYR